MSINRNAKVVIVSALGQQRLVLEAMTSGAKCYLFKPFPEERVLKVLKEI